MAPLLVHQIEQAVRADLLVAKSLIETTPNVVVDLAARSLTSPSIS